MFAGGVEAQPLGPAVEQRRTAKGRLEAREAAADRWLAEPQRPTGGAQRAVPRHRQENAHIVPVHVAGDRRDGVAVAAEFLAGNDAFIEHDHDTILYRCISDLSI